MAFTRPTLKQIIKRIEGDFKSGLTLQTIIRRSFLAVFAAAFGGASHTLHGHIAFAILRKFFPDTGDEPTVIRWGGLFTTPRKAAQKAELTIDVVGTTGATLLVDTIYVRSDGTEYEVKADVIVPAAATVPATIVARDGFEGADANIDTGDSVSLQSALPGIESDSEVTATEVEGEDEEDLELYRQRVLDRMGFPPSGGTVPDFETFAKKVAGITRAWVLPNFLGEGTVGVTFVEDGNAPASIIPSPTKVDEVQVQLLLDEPQGTAGSTAFAPSELEMNLEIQLEPNTAAVQAAVNAELADLLLRDGEVRGASDPEKVGLNVIFDGKILLSKINEAISIAKDEDDHKVLNFTDDVRPLNDGGLVTLGTTVFSAFP